MSHQVRHKLLPQRSPSSLCRPLHLRHERGVLAAVAAAEDASHNNNPK